MMGVKLQELIVKKKWEMGSFAGTFEELRDLEKKKKIFDSLSDDDHEA